MKRETTAGLEETLGRVLSAGTQLTTVLLVAGLALLLWAPAAWLGPLAVHLGLVVLMLTPVARVVVSMGAYIRARQWWFVLFTGMVLVLLIGSFLAALER